MWIIILLCFLASTNSEIVNIKIQKGIRAATIQGETCCDGTVVGWWFRGIRFAQPPVGDLRFAYAKRFDPSGTVDARNYGPECSQSTLANEDCLFLNIYTPAGVTSKSQLPVMFHIHGGGLEQGSAQQNPAVFNNLINRGPLIIVSISYRLGPFGYFNQVIMESGSSFGGGVSMCDSSNSSLQLAVKVECATVDTWNSGKHFEKILKCMRSVSAADLQNADTRMPYEHFMNWQFVVDHLYLPETLDKLALKRPKFNVLAGACSTEWLAWETSDIINGTMNTPAFTRAGLIGKLQNTFEMRCWKDFPDVEKGAQNFYIDSAPYPDTDHAGWMSVWINLMSDLDFIAGIRRDAQYHVHTGSNVYLYSFDYLSPYAWTFITDPRLRGVPHTLEMWYIYDSVCFGYPCQPDDNILREYFQQAWTNFVVHGNPTPPEAKMPFTWPKLENDGTNKYLSFMPQPQAMSNYHPSTEYFTCVAPRYSGIKAPFCNNAKNKFYKLLKTEKNSVL
ncbi:hypothetical protein WR25_23900 [Diploscapter pachys]|uniref:Carboxylesterase type B domain-containing protein n=1 Tax=Diploscapter pachys TaxID=2018661 RepID=A0A2A2LJ75_9BILA|nr:hypothetical protein WR25_23900 [Diploscapter pachys]